MLSAVLAIKKARHIVKIIFIQWTENFSLLFDYNFACCNVISNLIFLPLPSRLEFILISVVKAVGSVRAERIGWVTGRNSALFKYLCCDVWWGASSCHSEAALLCTLSFEWIPLITVVIASNWTYLGSGCEVAMAVPPDVSFPLISPWFMDFLEF